LLATHLEVLKDLCHKHLIALYQAMEMRTGSYLFMEPVPSGSVLDRLLQESGPAGCQGEVPWSVPTCGAAKAVLSQTFCRSCAYTCPKILKVLPLYALLLDCMPFDATNLWHLIYQTQLSLAKAAPVPGLQ
ncbi:PREDICTED: testis-specific serine/threonine-protein kinase 4-like, partial [Buceros rhinoceros silvestris]|uniref:testis-specific serine/threonine-protein kinase 4-like n=1 Tax=Buceros rhinoceros silvestris TaxID=175836 RepID=UPI0005283059